MIDLTMAMVKKRINDIDAQSLTLITESRKPLRDAKLAKAKLTAKPRCTWIWSRWTGKVRRIT